MTKPLPSPSRNDPGPEPELLWLKLSQLYIDPAYQRSAKSKASLKNVAHMTEHFSWAHCGALTVAAMPEKGQYAVVDGQHRLVAALARGDIGEMPCVVVGGQDVVAQAKSFVAVNSRRVILNSLAAFHAAVAAGDPDAVSVKEIADECGIDIPRTPVLKGDLDACQTQAVGTLAKMLGTYSRKQIVFALTVVPEAYGDERGQLRANVIRAVAEFIKRNPDAARGRFVDALRDVDLLDLEADARAYQRIKGGTITAAMVEPLERLYRGAGRKGAA